MFRTTGLHATRNGIIVPKDVIMDILSLYRRMEEVMATLEVMTDEETLRSIQKSKQQINKGEFVDADIHKVEDVLG